MKRSKSNSKRSFLEPTKGESKEPSAVLPNNAKDESKEQENEAEDKLQVEPPPFSAIKPHRIFINHLDTYHGRVFSLFFSEQIVDATKGLQETEDAEAEDEEEQNEKIENKTEQHFYEIVGTAIDLESFKPPEEISELYCSDVREVFWPKLWSCGNIIYDITLCPFLIEEVEWALEMFDKAYQAHMDKDIKEFKRSKDFKVFAVVSPITTWALTKPIDPDEPDVPFTEADYRKRVPHPNYKKHLDLEKRIFALSKKYKHRFRPLILGCGATYGGEEGVFHFLFRAAWHNEPLLPFFLPGHQHIPTIHIKDLCGILLSVIEKPPKKIKYILAVEPVVSTLREIVKAISSALSTGKIKKITKEDALVYTDIIQPYYDILVSNINVAPEYVTDEIDIRWHSDVGIVDNINNMVTEYKDALHLKPIRIIIHGAPAVGKTVIAKRLCKDYKLHYVCVKDLISETLQNLKQITSKKDTQAKQAQKGDEEQDDAGNEEEEEDRELFADAWERLEEIEKNMQENDGRLDDFYVIKLLKDKLNSNPCLNQGFVLDGYPKTIDQAMRLFEPTGEEEEMEEEGEEGELEFNRKIMPEFVFSLDAPDNTLMERVIGLPQEEVEGTHHTVEEMSRRLSEFRSINSEESTVLNFYDELEVHPIVLSVKDETRSDMDGTYRIVTDIIGPCRNYGPTDEEMEEIIRLEEERCLRDEQEEMERARELEEKLKPLQRQRAEKFAALLAMVKEEEEEVLAINSIPSRNYLMKYILPTVTAGLLEVAEYRPSDPVDYLAEYIFKHNPEGKMLEKHLAYQDVEDFEDMRDNSTVKDLHEFEQLFEDRITPWQRDLINVKFTSADIEATTSTVNATFDTNDKVDATDGTIEVSTQPAGASIDDEVSTAEDDTFAEETGEETVESKGYTDETQ